MELAVITEVPDPTKDAGNLAMPNRLFRVTAQPSEENGYLGAHEEVKSMELMLSHKQEVFHVGEILVLDDNGREVAGLGRKPDKWNVSIHYFSVKQIDKAVELAKQVCGW